MITVDRLTKKYGAKTAVEDLSFTVPDGLVTGFLGPNGSGKSTTMRCMLGLDAPTSGQVLFSGSFTTGTYAKQPFAALPHKMNVAGAILDASWFAPSRSGRNHLRAIARGAGISDARVEECLDLVGMTDAGKYKVGGYSLGMKQRLGVATALLGRPQHLIFDEPINGLDPEGVTWMRDTIRRQAAEGRSVLVSSHLLSEMQLTADRVVVIGRGKLIGEYSMDEFLAGGMAVEVETPQVEEFAELVRALGMGIQEAATQPTNDSANTFRVPVPTDVNEAEIRRRIAETAMERGIVLTRLTTKRDNLEQRFLAATAEAQEYSTTAIDTTIDTAITKENGKYHA
ncbi:ABC transporter ATP-binding protein [Corynebacterium sp. H113]|uniref:ABC transporter ATP-binding protein n=1 Tax=Corynebacterium sp. H113 TaxID=3133419 RepID=UPI0030B605CB